MTEFQIKAATDRDVPVLVSFIRLLAEYEKLSEQCVVSNDVLRESLFGKRRVAEAVIGYFDDRPVGFALFFHNFSTFLGRPGLYLEDLFVIPEMRGRGFGKALLVHLAGLARERGCGRFEWSVLDWNEPAIQFYKNLGAVPMDEWTVYRVTGNALNRLADEAG